MAIKGPKGAEPTLRGWVNPNTGELLKSQRISQSDVDQWHGIDTVVYDINQRGKLEAVLVDSVSVNDEDDIVADFNSDGNIDEFESMTKSEIEQYGRDHGIELDRRKNKKSMIEELKAHKETL